MKRLIPRREMNKHSLTRIESPFFAAVYINRALLHPLKIEGLTNLISECGSSISDCLYERDKAAILQKVERGDWLLISDDPFSPLSQDTFGTYSHLTGKVFSCGGSSFRQIETAREPVLEREPLTLPKVLELAQRKSRFDSGPGKWVIKNIDYDGVKNTLAILVNRAGSLTDEGRVIFSDGKDFANTTRTLVQEWLPLGDDENSFEAGSAVHFYRALRYIKQHFQESEDEWQVTGKSWHWTPVTADTVYERRVDEQ